MRLEALEHLFFYVFDVGEPVPQVTSQFLRSRYFSRRCCLQMSAVCFCRFLVPNAILCAEFLYRILYAGDVGPRINPDPFQADSQ
jgi:hypothetical protein